MVDSKGENEPGKPKQRVDEVTRGVEAPLGAGLARGVGAFLLIPTMMAVGPALGYLLGAWLERRYGHAPWLGFAGVVLGAVASVRQIIRILRTYKPTGASERRRDDGP